MGTRAWSPVLVGLAKLTDVEVSIGGALGVLAAQVEEGVIKSVQHPERTALNGEVQRMIEALEDRDRRRASQLMLRRIRPIDDDDEPIWAAARELSSDHARVDAPVLLLWGRHDDILPLAATREKLQSEIPGSRLVVIDDARHSVHQEEPFATAREIIRFVDAQASELPASRWRSRGPGGASAQAAQRGASPKSAIASSAARRGGGRAGEDRAGLAAPGPHPLRGHARRRRAGQARRPVDTPLAA